MGRRVSWSTGVPPSVETCLLVIYYRLTPFGWLFRDLLPLISACMHVFLDFKYFTWLMKRDILLIFWILLSLDVMIFFLLVFCDYQLFIFQHLIFELVLLDFVFLGKSGFQLSHVIHLTQSFASSSQHPIFWNVVRKTFMNQSFWNCW